MKFFFFLKDLFLNLLIIKSKLRNEKENKTNKFFFKKSLLDVFLFNISR